MGKYKLMLVDDEPWALIGIKEIIDWEAEGFTVAACCGSGSEALEMAGKIRPDAVITDIRMPDISGLELIERLRRWQSRIQCAVVSAYSDFEVARQAIRLAAAYYILKPLSAGDVREAAGLMRESLERQEAADGQQGEREAAIWEVDVSRPGFPQACCKGRSVYLLLSDVLASLPDRVGDAGLWQPVQIGSLYGILTDRLPGEVPGGCGISPAFPDFSRAEEMIRAAEASLEGGFRFVRSEDSGKSQVSVADIQLYLYSHLDENITIGQLARHFFITETYLCDIFKKQTGETVVHFVRRLRIARSRKLLASSALSLCEIAARCGYRDYSYFGKHFKADVGMSPDLYRKKRGVSLYETGRDVGI